MICCDTVLIGSHVVQISGATQKNEISEFFHLFNHPCNNKWNCIQKTDSQGGSVVNST